MSETVWPTKLAGSRVRKIMETVGKDATYNADRREWRMGPDTLRAVLEHAFAEGRLSGLMED